MFLIQEIGERAAFELARRTRVDVGSKKRATAHIGPNEQITRNEENCET